MTQIRKESAGPRPPGQARPRTPKQAARSKAPIDQHLAPELFKALSDPTRASLVACIAKCGRGCSVGEVAECCSVDMSVVSRHLALLARSGVLEVAKEGRVVRYRVRYAEVTASLRALADALEQCCPDDAECCSDGTDDCCVSGSCGTSC
jgi:DNA-binding transcriptional ArsR family regulator